MKKEDIISSIIYIIMLLIILLVGFLVIQPNIQIITNIFGRDSSIWFLIISFLVGFLLNVLFVELGHLIGAKIGNYEIISFNVLGLCIYKNYEKDKKGKWNITFKSFDGLAGETRIAPKDKNAKPTSYIIGPFVLILIEFIALLLSFLFINDDSSLAYLKYGLIIVCTIGGIFILYDYVPFKLDSLNDGYRWTMLTNKTSIEGYNEYLMILNEIEKDGSHHEINLYQEINDFTVNNNLLKAKELILEKDYENSIKILDDIINALKVSSSIKENAKIEKLFILSILKDENAKEFLNSLLESTQKEIKRAKTILGARTYFAYLKVYDPIEDEINLALNQFERLFSKDNDLTKEIDQKLLELAKETFN